MENQGMYSEIIDPKTYNEIIGQHLYISDADQAIARIVYYYADACCNVVEMGCGPARIFPSLARTGCINLTGIDHDPMFVAYGQELLKNKKLQGEILLDDVLTYQHHSHIDIAVSQGFHHHISKGEQTKKYLTNIYRQLRKGGIYIVGDEFLPNYQDEKDRSYKAVIWYCHIINAAMEAKFFRLANEEAKTLLDDLAEGTQKHSTKSREKISFVIARADQIDQREPSRNHPGNQTVKVFLAQLESMETGVKTNDSSVDLSRGDFKICHRVFKQEVTEVGFKIIGVKTIGPIETIGGMAIYTLLKE